MQPPSSVFVLKPNLTDPRFHGFVWPDAPSLIGLKEIFYDFKVENGGKLNWQPRRLQSVWKPLKVHGPVNAFNDYPCLELKTPVFSRRAVDALGTMLSDQGELLPLITDAGEYFAYVCLTKLDVLDQKKSRILRPSEPGATAFDIEYFAFKKKLLTNAAIFRVPEHPGIYLVSDQFKARAEEAALNGMTFIKVWPLPESSDWGMEEAARRKKSKAVKLVGESLILRLRLKKPQPSPKEKRFASDIEQSLRSELHVSSLEQRYWGSVEVTEFEDGEYRVFCSCPSCDQLTDHLSDWFESVVWENDFDIVKRYGHLYDKKAKEKRIQIRALYR
jgi:hypothetical protein